MVGNTWAWHLASSLKRLRNRLLHSRGDGVHSPYAYRLIRDVVRCPYPYDAYRTLYKKTEAQALRMRRGVSALTRRKDLELIFRLTHAWKPDKTHLIATSESLIFNYVSATGYRNLSEEIRGTDLIIIEHEPPRAKLSRPQQGERLMIIINKRHPPIRQWAKEMQVELQPPIIFDLVDLDLWVWREATTSGFYPVYH